MRIPVLLAVAAVLAGCTGGGSGGTPQVPPVPWGSFRHDTFNSAASGIIDTNKGRATLLASAATLGGVTLSTPAIDRSGNVIIGTADGVIALDGNPHCSANLGQGCTGDSCLPDGGVCECVSDNNCACSGSGRACNPDTCTAGQGTCTGTVRWTFSQFDPNDCSKSCPSPPCGPAGPQTVGSVVASPSVTAGDDIVVGTGGTDGEPGRIFALREQGKTIQCLWVSPPDGGATGSGVKSSALTLVYNLDLTLTTAVVGDDDGRLRAFNFDGSVRWTFPRAATGSPITSSPALDTTGVSYVTTDDGMLVAIDAAGTPEFQFSIGVAPASELYPSPAVGATIYAIGAGSALFAITPSNTRSPKWQFVGTEKSISGSPAFLSQNFPAESANTLDTIVYVVDQGGKAYGVRDSNGTIMPIQRCSITKAGDLVPSSCRTDNCLPFGQTCNTSTARCEGGAMPNLRCTPDSCLPDLGTCVVTNGIVQVAQAPGEITTSPIVSADQFAVVGTTDGQVCARSLANLVPGQDVQNSNAAWAANGCIALGGDANASRSSPVIGLNGEIYLTTDAGLYIIK